MYGSRRRQNTVYLAYVSDRADCSLRCTILTAMSDLRLTSSANSVRRSLDDFDMAASSRIRAGYTRTGKNTRRARVEIRRDRQRRTLSYDNHTGYVFFYFLFARLRKTITVEDGADTDRRRRCCRR